MNTANPASPFDRDSVERLVAEVIRRIEAGSIEAESKGSPAARPAALPAAGDSPVVITDRVITLRSLERLPAGTRRVVVDPKAVVTPSARDHAKEHAIAIERGAASGAAATAAAPRPFFIAHAQCKADPSAKAAAIARAVPGSQHLPASGLPDLIATLALHASRDAARGILLTSRPAVAVILANRSASLRAVTGRDAASLAASAADCQANLLIVDPAAFAGGLERLGVEFATRPTGAIPSELASAPAGCGCTTH